MYFESRDFIDNQTRSTFNLESFLSTKFYVRCTFWYERFHRFDRNSEERIALKDETSGLKRESFVTFSRQTQLHDPSVVDNQSELTINCQRQLKYVIFSQASLAIFHY